MNFPYRDSGVDIQFPAQPDVKQTTYPTASASVPAIVYSYQQDTVAFTLTVVDFSNDGKELGSAADSVIDSLRKGGGVTLDLDECISGQPGHEFSLKGSDGSASKVSVFAVERKLYLLEAKASPPNVDRDSGDISRFQQSMSFAGGELGEGPRVSPICRGKAGPASRVNP
jgi:hypothetical protein